MSNPSCTWLPALPVLAVLLTGCAGELPQPKSEPPAVVKVLPITQGPVAAEIPVVGSVVPIETSRVAAGAPGKVVSFPFREGALVKQGQLLAQLRDVTTSIELEAARAMLRQREQLLAQLRAGYRLEEIAQAESAMRAAQSASQLAAATAGRIRTLHERPDQPVTDQELDDAVFGAQRAEHELAKAQADFDMKRSGYRSEEIAAATAALEAQQQEVARLTDELEKRKVLAPFTGYLAQKNTEVGEWVDLGGFVATLVRLDEVEIRVNVEEQYVEEIQLGQSVQVLIDALRDKQGAPAEFQGRVVSVVPKARWEQGSRSFPVIVRMANQFVEDQPLLKEGMVARITFRGRPRQALLAHKDAIMRTDGKPKLYLIDSDRKARPVEVVEGLSTGSYVEVRGELREGDLVATEGVERLRPFGAVSVMDSPVVAQQPAAVSPTGPTMSPAAEPSVVERKPAGEANDSKTSGG